MTTASITRSRISDEFLAANRCRRVLDGLAAAIVEKGYRGASIADIVRCAGCARKTFYDTFGGKGEAGRMLLAAVCPVIDRNPEDGESIALAVELAALWRSGEEDTALARAEEALHLLGDLRRRGLDLGCQGESLTKELPPGRHGLPRRFVRANQRHRLLCGLATAVAENGYVGTTIAHITRHAAVSRRTFYEHFTSGEDAALALLEAVDVAAHTSPVVNAVVVEVVADKLTGGNGRTVAEPLLRVLIARFQESETSEQVAS